MAFEINFKEGITRLFKKLDGELNEIVAEMDKYDSTTITTYTEMASKDSTYNYAYTDFEKLVAAMMLSSTQLKTTLQQIHAFCNEGMQKSTDKKIIKDISEIVQKLKDAEKFDFAIAQRLPFTINGEGWKAKGEISGFRRRVNFAGYMLTYPVLSLYDKKKGRIAYEYGIAEMNELVKMNTKTIQSWGTSSQNSENAIKEIKNAIKDLKIFTKIFNDFVKRIRRARNDILKILNDHEDKYGTTTGLKVGTWCLENKDQYVFYQDRYKV